VAKHIYTYIKPVRPKDVDEVVACLHNDGVVALPLDVSWAFVCNASSSHAVERVRRLKPTHPKSQPFSLLCASISAASKIVIIENETYRWLKKMLPGPYTVLLDRQIALPKIIHDKRKEVGLRIPDCDLATAIIQQFDGILAASTIPACVPQTDDDALAPPHFGWQVAEYFGHGIDIICDLGEESPCSQTTIVDLRSGIPEIIREGLGKIALE
jgi:tRNA threonylcarbamoyl adenosine modification protein (Sua5/YciO/YrdC/YwlC family)